MVRVVVDTNVLVSALIHHGKPRRVVLKLLQQHTVILSPQILAELADVLARGKFLVKSSQVDRYLSVLARKSKMVSPEPRFRVVAQDPDDDIVLWTSSAGKADYIVTGDRHLLSLKEFKNTEIVNVSQLLDILR